MKPTQIIKQYLLFSRGEQRGIFILTVIILAINLCRIYIPNDRKMDPMEFTAFQHEIERFEQALEQSGNIPLEQFTRQASPGSSYPLAGKDSVPVTGKTPTPSFILELNSADTLDLQRLRGIGPSYARRITGYRQRLGGFVSINQLLEVFGMDSARFNGIKSHLTVDPSAIDKMNINSIPFKELIAHPYMPYDLAKEIAIYRKKHKGIGTWEELQGLKDLDSITWIKLYPYIEL